MIELEDEDFQNTSDGDFQIITEEYIQKIIKEEKLKMK
jgi:hypothetical protein